MHAESNVEMLLSSHSLDPPPRTGDTARRVPVSSRASTSVRQMLACVDGSELGSGIVPHAQVVAQALGARLTLLRVLESEPSVGGAPPDPLDWGIRQREAQASLDRLAAPLLKLEHGIQAELIQGRPAEQICAWAEQHGIDLTVLCSHGARGVTDWDLASTARKLIERAPGSLLLVPAPAAVKGGEVRYRRILVPLDGSLRAESVLPIASRIAISQNADLIFVHVVPVPEITRNGLLDEEGVELERQVTAYNRRIATLYLDRVRARVAQSGIRVRTIVVGDGTPQQGLERLIREEEADLVVMSAHGSSARIDSPCGRLTEHALTHAITPLLVVRGYAARRARRVRPMRTPTSERIASPDLRNS